MCIHSAYIVVGFLAFVRSSFIFIFISSSFVRSQKGKKHTRWCDDDDHDDE